jgi:hypothetical protein
MSFVVPALVWIVHWKESFPRALDFIVSQVHSSYAPQGLTRTDAGLTTEERELVAIAYDSGVISVIVATCGLAAGINLPARRVILHGARMGSSFIGPSLLWVLSPYS